MSTLRLEGKRAVVTGATAGIGEAVAKRFASEGASLVLVARNDEAGERLMADLPTGCSMFVRGDVAERDTAKRVVDAAGRSMGGVDILVNNAALDYSGDLLDADWEDVHRVFSVNFFGQLTMLQEVARTMRDADGGSIVNITSRTAVVGVPTMAVYGASKGALLSLTRAAAIELAPHSIRVNAVSPGLTDTPLVRAWLRSAPDPAEREESAKRCIPQARFGEPKDVASAVLYLASDEAAYVTGAMLPVDGGYTAQ